MRTERLYYSDCYLHSFEARVLKATDGGCRVYLDRTAFYPTSGGQPNDVGTLGEQTVLDVIDEDDRIAHLLTGPLESDVVRGVIDWERRYDHMQQHTGQHLLSAVFVELFAYATVSFHLSSDTATIELATKEISGSQIAAAAERANQIVREARPVKIRFEHALEIQALRKPSVRCGMLRVIEIENLDRSACGGTHVLSTSELGPIQIRKSEKIRSNVRLHFVCGSRALRRANEDFRIIADLARDAGVPIDGLTEHVTALRYRLRDAEKELQRVSAELAREEGEALYEKTETSPDGLRRILLRVPAIDDAVRLKVQAFTTRGHGLALVMSEETGAVLVATSADSGVNAGAVIKMIAARAGGRGGGSATLAQGNLPGIVVQQSLSSVLGFTESELARKSNSDQNEAKREQSDS